MPEEMSASKRAWITGFVIAWNIVFHYESLRQNYLNPIFHAELPKVKFLFPPAGWIMFYNIEEGEGRAEVYGIKGKDASLIDPHLIFSTRYLGYDNIRRNILISVLPEFYAPSFCRTLKRKFPQYEDFAVLEVYVPSAVNEPGKKLGRISYRCGK